MESRFLVVKKQIGDGDKYLKLYFKIGRKRRLTVCSRFNGYGCASSH